MYIRAQPARTPHQTLPGGGFQTPTGVTLSNLICTTNTELSDILILERLWHKLCLFVKRDIAKTVGSTPGNDREGFRATKWVKQSNTQIRIPNRMHV